MGLSLDLGDHLLMRCDHLLFYHFVELFPDGGQVNKRGDESIQQDGVKFCHGKSLVNAHAAESAVVGGKDGTQTTVNIIAEDVHASHSEEGLRAEVASLDVGQCAGRQLVNQAVEVGGIAAFIADNANNIGPLKLKETAENLHQVGNLAEWARDDKGHLLADQYRGVGIEKDAVKKHLPA